jgi:hypothetical protein
MNSRRRMIDPLCLALGEPSATAVVRKPRHTPGRTAMSLSGPSRPPARLLDLAKIPAAVMPRGVFTQARPNPKFRMWTLFERGALRLVGPVTDDDRIGVEPCNNNERHEQAKKNRPLVEWRRQMAAAGDEPDDQGVAEL